ncbi:MAG: hypothetical protein ACLQDV_17370 [Candidatus Binataceae bacterium]
MKLRRAAALALVLAGWYPMISNHPLHMDQADSPGYVIPVPSHVVFFIRQVEFLGLTIRQQSPYGRHNRRKACFSDWPTQGIRELEGVY